MAEKTGFKEELEGLLGDAKQKLAIDVPFWAKIVVFFLRLIPGVPGWVITALPFIIGLIDKLPLFERKAARKDLIAAVKQAAKTQSVEPLRPVFKRVCVGSVCNLVKTKDNRLK